VLYKLEILVLSSNGQIKRIILYFQKFFKGLKKMI